MVLELTDPQSGTTLELFNAQQLTSDRRAQVNVSPATGQDSEQTFLTSLEQSGQVDIQGAVTGPRLARDGNYSNDPQTALAEWAVTFEEFVNGTPGDGYTLDLNYRSKSFTGVIENLRWTRRGGESLELGFSASYQRGQGAGPDGGVDPDSVGSDNYSVDGTTISTLREFQVSKSMGIQVFRRTFAEDPGDNDITVDSGVTRTITIVGQVKGTATERNTFRDNISQSLGQDTLIDVTDGLTGRTYTGMIESFEGTDEAGLTRLGEFGIEFVEGTN